MFLSRIEGIKWRYTFSDSLFFMFMSDSTFIAGEILTEFCGINHELSEREEHDCLFLIIQ